MKSHTARGLINIPSPHDVLISANRLEVVLRENSMHMVARVNHAQGAAKVGMELRPTELFIFGNPLAGTPMMQSCQTVAIDLPQKILIWQDEQDVVWLSFNDPRYLVERHSLDGASELAGKMLRMLEDFIASVVAV